MRNRVSSARLWRFAPLVAIAAVGLLLIAGVVIVYSGERTYLSQKEQEAAVETRILASTVGAALTFDDRAAAATYVHALAVNPEIEAVAVYDRTGTVFAEFTRPEAELPDTPPSPGLTTRDDRIQAVALVYGANSARVGRVYVRAVLEPLRRRLETYVILGLLVVMAALAAAVLGVAQLAQTRLNLELAAANASLEAEIANRESAEEALRQSQKMEAIGQLTGGVAHDFNNILQVILGNLGAIELRLARGNGDPGALARMVQAATRAADRAAVLTGRLLAFARRQPLQPKPLDANRLLTGMSDLLHRTLGEGIEVETVLGARLWQALTDANQLESAILNLAVNARDAMPAGGKLTIETANAYLDEAYAASEPDVHAGQYVVISVTDTGTGMSPDVTARAFDPFFTTKDIGHGTGLGLAQVYGFIKQSGGHAKIYSEPDEGTTVKLYLPRLLNESTEGELEVPIGELPQGERETLLVVEDEADARRFVADTLRELGYEVLEAADGRAALRLLEARRGIKMLFTDVGLPGGMNGRQLADTARQLRPGLLVLYMTGYARNAIVHQGRLDPGVELIHKPFTYAALARRVREVLDSA